MVKDFNSCKYGITQVVNSHKGNRRLSPRSVTYVVLAG